MKIYTEESKDMIKAGIIGSTGYAGGELARLLLQRDDVEIKWYGSRSYIDQKYASIYQNMFKIVDDKCMDDNMKELADQVDVIFTATPQGLCSTLVNEEILSKVKIIDLSADFRIGIDVMTTETTCLSSIWKTDDKIKEFYDIHGRSEDYKELNPGAVAYYDGMVYVNLSEIKPMIAMPFHPSNVYTIDEVRTNLKDILHDVEQKALVSLDGAVNYSLQDKIVNGQLYVDQGIIAGCAGGGFENICDAADIDRKSVV